MLADERFADRWTVFFGDMLRIRSNAEGGAPFMAYVHKAVEVGVPYDEMCRRLISANGKPGRVPEVGFILGDNVDPMALAGTTAQVFMGVRIACAQCHDHPFDVWTREQFYGFAAYFGKTRRIESQLTKQVYTTETQQTTVLWPPEDEAKGAARKPMPPAFPFETMDGGKTPEYIVRLKALRERLAKQGQPKGPSLDDLLAAADDKAKKATEGALPSFFDVAKEAQKERRSLNVMGDLYRTSELRTKLAEMVTSPRNRYFAKCLVNRVWAEVLGHGFVEPIDDFSAENRPSHPKTLDYLADEFVANGYDVRSLLRVITNSQAYQRGRLLNADEQVREDAEAAFTSASMRRMLAESLFDSMVQAGHLFDYKYPQGANLKTVSRLQRVAIPREGGALASVKGDTPDAKSKAAMSKPQMVARGGYDLESAIEVDFDALLKAKDDEPSIDQMKVMSKEELEAMQMMKENKPNSRMRYVERYVDVTFDDNPRFSSAMRMAAPAAPSHFLRIFGQPARQDLGDHRTETASMRQALMMLNGKLSHEASRVGEFEPVYPLLIGKKADLDKAVKLVYREILTRTPSQDEVAEAKQIIASADGPRAGLADLRWVLFNCHEFRFLP